MKRLLAAILAVSMLFSCMMTSAFAQGLTQAAQRSDVTYGISNGWNWEATTALKTHGEASVSKAFAANANLSHAGILCCYEPTSDVKVDASEADAFVFDFYVSDAAAIRNVMSEIEISSCGHPDVEERRYMGFVNDLIPGGLQDGWNTVVIPFEEMSDQFRDQPIDLTRINFFRQYFYALTTGEKKLTVAYDYLRFTKDGEVVAVLSDCEIGEVIPPEEPDEQIDEIVVPSIDHSIPGWEITPEKWNAHFDLKTPDKTNACLLRKWDANATLGVNIFNVFWFVETDAGFLSFDISTADTFAIDMWISDVSMVTGKQFQIELANGGYTGIDTNEATYNGTLDALVDGGLKNGWNTIKLPIASMGKTGKGADWTKIDWFRLYNAENITTGADGLSVAIDNVCFLKGDAEIAVMSECQPNMNGWDKCCRPLVVGDANVMGQTWTNTKINAAYGMFRNQNIPNFDISGMKYVEFDVYISDIAIVDQSEWLFEMRDADGGILKINAFWPGANTGWKSGWNHVKWNLANLENVGFDATNLTYFRFVNHHEVDVTGKSLTIALDNFRFTTDAAPGCANCHVSGQPNIDIIVPEVPPEGAVNILLSDGTWDIYEGVILEMNGQKMIGKVIDGDRFKVCDIYVNYMGETGIDVSAMKYLEYDLYISDVEALKNVTLTTEINSSGDYDRNELEVVRTFADYGLKNGWNRIKIDLSKMMPISGPCDLTSIKWFRIYTIQEVALAHGLTYAITNVRFTDDMTPEIALPGAPLEKPDEPNEPTSGIFKDIAADQNKGSTDQGWRNHKINLTHMTVDGHSAIGQTVIGARPLTDVRFHYYHTTPVDTTKYSHLEFDLYVEDAAKLPEGFALGIELSSSGLSDVEEISTEVFSLTTGWNHIKIAFSDFYASSQEAYNLAAWNYTRLYFFNGNYLQGEQEELTIAIGEFNFTYSETQPEEPEEPSYSATVYFKDRANGQTLASAKTVTGKTGEQFVVNAPLVEGYTTTTDRLTVTIGTAASNYTIWYDKKEQSAPEPTIPIGGSDIPLTGGRWNGNCKTMTVDGISGIGNTYTSNLTIAGIYHEWTTDTPLDISDAKYLEFDLYISNAMAFKNTNLMFELTSSGTMDQEEIGITINSGWHGLRNGWNHIQWSLFDLLTHSAVGTFDPSNFNYFRFCNVRDIDLGGQELTVILANVKFTTGGATLDKDENGNVTQGKEHFVLTPVREDRTDPSNSPNKDYVVNITAGSNVEKFYADAKTEIVYKVPVTHASTARKILLTIKAGGQYWLQAGTDGQTWNDVYKFYDVELEQNGGMGNKSLLRATYTFDLTDAVIGADGKMDGNYIYIRLLDAYPAQGWGSNMFYEPAVFEIVYDLNGAQEPEQPEEGKGYATIEELGDAFLADFNKYGETTAAKESFHHDSSAPIKKALANAEMLQKWNWLWVYMLDHLKATNPDATSAYLTDAYPVLEKMIAGDTTAILDKANARTTIRSYIHGFLNGMKGCGEINTDFSVFSPDFSSADEQTKLLNAANGAETPDLPPVNPPVQEETKTDEYVFTVCGDDEKQYLDPDYQGIAPVNSSLRFADCSAYFIYKYDLKSFRGVEEITFEAIMGGQLHVWASADGKNWVEIVKYENRIDAKNMKLNLSILAEAVAQTAELYIKIGDAVTTDGNGGQIRSGAATLRVTYDASADQTPIVNGGIAVSMRENYWSECWAEENFHGRFAQIRVLHGGSYGPGGLMFVYGNDGKAPAVDISDMQFIEFDIYVSNVNAIADVRFGFELSSRGTCDLEENSKYFWGKDTGWVNGWNHVKWPLTDFGVQTGGVMDMTRWNYLRWYNWTQLTVGDAFEVGMANLCFTGSSAADLDAEEATKTEHSVPLWGANETWGETWGGGWEIDNDNQTAGSGCVSVNLNGKRDVVADIVFDVPVNAQGMDTFEFEIYLSDLRILDFFTSATAAIEVSSSGMCDHEEISIVGRQLADWLKAHGATVGWNHVAIPLSKMAKCGGELDISRINYLRFYIVGLQDVNEDYVIKLDNFRMTDALVADKTEFEKNHADLIVTLEKLSAYENVLSITADNFSYVSEQVRYAGSQVNSLTENERAVADAMGILSHLTKAEKALNAYRNILMLKESLLNSIDDLAKKYAVITENNYEAALIDIPYARDQYQSLSQRDRQVIANAGYLAKLEAAEAVLDAYVPEESVPEDAPKLKVESVTTYVGGTVDVRVWIENNPGVIGMNLNMEYDSNQLELLAVADGGLMSGEKLFGDQLSQNPYTLVWEDAFATENNTANGVLVTFTFKVKDNATVGDIVLNLSYTTIINVALEHVAFATIDGVITVVDYISGDVNDDGNVNGLDVAVFRRHLANWEGYEEINESAADVNRDGVVDLIDVVILRRYLAGWDGVELK